MPRPNFQWTVGDGANALRVGEPEQGWFTSNAVRAWWMYFSWWVIPLGVLWLFFGPRAGHISLGSESVVAPAPQVIERVVERPAPTPVRMMEKVQSPPADPTADMSPEDRRLYERLVLRK